LRFITDFHIHSHFSIATSKNLVPEHLDYWAKRKGIHVIGTGDCIHPGWVSELREKLEPAGNGLFVLKKEYRLEESSALKNEHFPEDIYFMLTGELSSIYKKDGKVRKVHNICVFPDMDSLEKVQSRLDRMGNIRSDGRPILGIDSKDILEMVLESSDRSFLIPAHIWTPWFSVLGSKSGFDSLEECYEDLTDNIFAVETGLSSDPEMNWMCGILDRFKLVSNSDAHSPEKLGREANIFDTDLSYDGILQALKGDTGFCGTIEFFPQEGKYHLDGHRKCGIRWDPLETVRHGGICPVCGKPVTRGVLYRVAELADRTDTDSAPQRRDFHSITQLPDLIAEMFGQKSCKTKAVQKKYSELLTALGPEFHILLDSDRAEIERAGGAMMAEGIIRLRNGNVIIDEGYDGEFGRVRVFDENETAGFKGGDLFTAVSPVKEKQVRRNTMKFDMQEFREIKNSAVTGDSGVPGEGGDRPEKGDAAGSGNQQEGIEHLTGPCVVIAGPGSGKTHVLTSRITRLVTSGGVDPGHILALTFSNRAAGEIRQRLEKSPAASGVNVSTFHGFGLGVLREYFDRFDREIDFRVLDPDEQEEVLASVSGKATAVRRDRKIISAVKEQYMHGEDSSALMQAYEEELRKINAFDLADLVYRPLVLFQEYPDTLEVFRSRFPWILVDEFQDINAVQYRLIRMLAGSGEQNLFVIGDPDQAIYGFRGSDVRFIRELDRDFPGIRTISLGRSYRCPDNVITLAGQVLLRDTPLQGKVSEKGAEPDKQVSIIEMETERSEADWIASRIEMLMGGVRSFSMDSGISDGTSPGDGLAFSDFAILCRSSFMFPAVTEALVNHGIAFRVIGTEPFYRQEPFRSAVSLFSRVYYRGLVPGSGDIEKEVFSMTEMRSPVSEVMAFILREQGAGADAVRRLDEWAGIMYEGYDEFFRSLATRQGNDDYDSGAEAVSVMTIHSSKGLEFNTVFIPGCEEGLIPFELFGAREETELAEEERLLYVGITRTSQSLYFSHAGKRVYRGRVLRQKRSRFLDRIERELLQVETREPGSRKEPDGQLDLFES